VRRALWAIEVDESEPASQPQLPTEVLTGGPESYPVCRREADSLRAEGARRLSALSAALKPGEARGWRVEGTVLPGPDREARTMVLFGPRPDLVGWEAVARGHPEPALLNRVRHFQA
jgi:hypothetical protein